MKSLLDILKEEKELVRRFNSQSDAIDLFEEQLERIRNLDVDCKVKEDNINYYEVLIEEYQCAILETTRELDKVRLEIRNYFKELL